MLYFSFAKFTPHVCTEIYRRSSKVLRIKLSTLEQKVLINILVGDVLMDICKPDHRLTDRQTHAHIHMRTYRSVKFSKD